MSATSHEPFLLPHLNRQAIVRAYEAAAGQEIQSGKMSSPESSSALVANAFGYFLELARMLPPLPGLEDLPWKVQKVCLEHQVRFPWAGGRHPWLDVFAETESHLIGIESKRFEPFRGPHVPAFSEAYWRDVWDVGMAPYLALRDELKVAGES